MGRSTRHVKPGDSSGSFMKESSGAGDSIFALLACDHALVKVNVMSFQTSESCKLKMTHR
jgi:hypothetical protein